MDFVTPAQNQYTYPTPRWWAIFNLVSYLSAATEKWPEMPL